jgi:hypothetical protein
MQIYILCTEFSKFGFLLTEIHPFILLVSAMSCIIVPFWLNTDDIIKVSSNGKGIDLFHKYYTSDAAVPEPFTENKKPKKNKKESDFRKKFLCELTVLMDTSEST